MPWSQLEFGDEKTEDTSPIGDLETTLGPPLEFLPKDIEPDELQVYRSTYQAFRAGCALGARGEIKDLGGGPPHYGTYPLDCRGRALETPGTWAHHRLRRGTRLVPLIGLTLAESSASKSALSAASEHHQELDDLLDLEGRPASTRHCGANATPAPSSCASSSDMAALAAATVALDSGAALNRQVSKTWIQFLRQAGLTRPRAESLPPPLHNSSTSAVTSQQGLGMWVHILSSMACLLPCLLTPDPNWWHCLGLPAFYATVVLVFLMQPAKPGAGLPGSCGRCRPWSQHFARVLRMERLVSEGCVPPWFPMLCTVTYVLVATSLALARTVGSGSSTRGISLWSATPQRHQYSCWGSDSEDVADCVLVRHAACTVLVSFYTCLAVTAVCNRNVKGMKIVLEHRQSLLDLFPLEAPCIFSYVERSVDSNSLFWRNNARHHYKSVAMSCAWTLISFGVYAGLLEDAKTLLAQAVFLAAVPATYALQFTLLRHVLLRVLLYLESVKARAFAMAYCDEEGVLPFMSSHAIYVWFCVRRNVQAQNEVEYQHVIPLFGASFVTAGVFSIWVASQLLRRGLSVFALTWQGGASLMAVASASISCDFVGHVLTTFLDIGKLEEAHTRQLRIAQMRLEHAKGQQMRAAKIPQVRELEGAVAMIERVILFLDQHDPKASVFGVEIGSKSFQVVYAALLSNGWYLLVWGVLVPIITADSSEQ